MFGKIFEQIFDSSIIEDRNVTYVFMCMIILSDSTGIIDITRAALARRINCSLEEVNAALEKLESPDPASRSTAYEGRRLVRLDDHRDWGWFLPNKEKYRDMASHEERKTQNREAQRRHRSASVSKCQRPSAMSAHTDTDTDTDTDKVKSCNTRKRTNLTDEQFITSLKSNPAYKGIDLEAELGKMDAWLALHPGRQKTRRFVVGWLNRAEKPLAKGDGLERYRNAVAGLIEGEK